MYIFENNVAHSISGNGAVAMNVQNDCTEIGGFIAYKCTHSAIMIGGPSQINRGRDLISIDNHWGLAFHSGANGDVEVYSSKVYGSNKDNIDCPEGSRCDHCMDTIGVTLMQACETTHLDTQKKWFKHPLWKMCHSAMRGQATYYGL